MSNEKYRNKLKTAKKHKYTEIINQKLIKIIDSKFFRQITLGGATGDTLWKCLLCNSMPTTNILKHSKTNHHKAQVRAIENRQLNLNEGLNSQILDEIRDNEKSYSNTSGFYDSNVKESLSDSSLEEDCIEDKYSKPDFHYRNKKEGFSWYPFKNKEIMIGCIIVRCTQTLMSSLKWLYQLNRDLRTQMIKVCAKEYYIYEPALISGRNVVLPLLFYNRSKKLFAKVCRLNVAQLPSSALEIEISISWNLDFFTTDLVEISAEDFKMLYDEILVSDGACYLLDA
ncbi:hypothetical protein BY996DRAFT_6417983 [Phakopsora pachyrhizi]|nr:hypothetical protein BY996DRAFT_6417983 [Phakopsora pachyrhizi]